MQLTTESRRTRWLILLAAWIGCAALVLLHQAAVRDYVTLLNGVGLRDAVEAPTPLRQVIPARYADAQMWVRHVLAAREADAARVRHTTADNAPVGREVHWSSAFAWLLRGAAALHGAVTGQSGPRALERTLLWFNAPLLIALVVAFSAWAGRRAGAAAGVVVALALIGHPRFYEGFLPTYVDHHGIVTATVFGLVLGAAFMGAGWWRPAGAGNSTALPASRARAYHAAIVSAVCGAIGLWISAAAVLPVIAMVGGAGLAVAWAWGPAAQRAGASFEPMLWRIWGRVGAAASVVFYLVEYAPADFSLRLEVNHPLYALAWWGGAEFVAAAVAWRLAGTEPASRLARRVVLPLLAIAAVPVVIVAGGRAVFMVGDPFIGPLRHFVAEGKSLPAALRHSGLGPLAYNLASIAILVPAVIVLVRRRDETRVVVGFLTLITAALATMACFEMRWWLDAGAAQIVLLLALLASVRGATDRTCWRWSLAASTLLFLGPAVYRIARDRADNQNRVVAAGDLLQPLYRDIATTMRDSQPEGDIVLLANPNASAGISYFGRFQTLGTLYWENAPGLRAAAEIFSATTDDEALALLRARKVTHIAMVSTANFLGEYFQLLHPNSGTAEAKNSFGYRLASQRSSPAWLQPIAYRRPKDLDAAAVAVALFKVDFQQNEVERLYHSATALAAGGEPAGGEKLLEAALALAPAPERFALCESAGAAFYDFGHDAAAVRIFRRALAFHHDAGVATTVAWILATSANAALRDGIAALALVQPIALSEPDDPTVLSALAAAHAELGRFPPAVTAAERALAIIRAGGDRSAESLLQKRLAAYRANRPWRQ